MERKCSLNIKHHPTTSILDNISYGKIRRIWIQAKKKLERTANDQQPDPRSNFQIPNILVLYALNSILSDFLATDVKYLLKKLLTESLFRYKPRLLFTSTAGNWTQPLEQL
jgi:hypothetical protein